MCHDTRVKRAFARFARAYQSFSKVFLLQQISDFRSRRAIETPDRNFLSLLHQSMIEMSLTTVDAEPHLVCERAGHEEVITVAPPDGIGKKKLLGFEPMSVSPIGAEPMFPRPTKSTC
jgi:hypothetical protein